MAVYEEDQLLPLSALQHLLFCERQCALIHVEQIWADNRLTVEGALLHKRVDDKGPAVRPGVRIARALSLHNRRLGLIGRADVVEYHRVPGRAPPTGGVSLPGVGGLWGPFPVEYKRGRPKQDSCDRVQLCAQALCLEEMHGTTVAAGALFYGRTRRRREIDFTAELRAETERAAARLHELVDSGLTPPPKPGPHCARCSLRDHCLPDLAARRSARAYVRQALADGSLSREDDP
jgi:CRISPR-associated exonuclease Cas4